MSSSSFEINEGPSIQETEQQMQSEMETDSNFENMEDMSPGTIIFSPQDMKPIFQKNKLPKNRLPARFVKKPNKPTPQARVRDVALTEEQQKAEKIASRLEKIKDESGPIACDYCGRVMSSAKVLMQHMAIHDEFKPFKCTQCPRQFTRKVQLQSHVSAHGGDKQFECPVCHQRFSRRDCVKVHMRIHDKTKCAYCEVCHKSFLTTGALNIHMRIHRGEKPFKCHLCGKCFTQKNHLITHIKRHTNVAAVPFVKKLGPRMFQCDHCPRSFIRLSDYERHVQWNHGAIADLSNANLVTDDGHAEQQPVKAPKQLMKERSKRTALPRKRTVMTPIEMCTSSTQTDDSPGHVIIPRKYQQQQPGVPYNENAEPGSTPRRFDDDGYDVYDDNMDRNYSSDEDDTASQTGEKISIESTGTSAVCTDSAQDAAFDAIIGNSAGKQTDEADPLGNDQPNEYVFVIQNENDQPTVTHGEVSQEHGRSESIPNSSSLSVTTTELAASNVDLNRHLGSQNFMELVHSSYKGLSKGGKLITSEDNRVATSPVPMGPPAKRGRPKTKRTSLKGAMQLHLIRKSMVNFITDVAKSEASEAAQAEEAAQQELVAEQNTGDTAALMEQVMMDEDDNLVKKSKRQIISKRHGIDFICSVKTCQTCYPTSSSSSSSLMKSVVKNETLKAVKKEPILRQLAEEGSKSVNEMVNLVHFGVRNLNELEKPPAYRPAIDRPHISQIGPERSDENNYPSESVTQSFDEQFLAKTPYTDSTVSPPVDVKSFCIPTFSCKLCNREFRFEGKLHRHIEAVHQNKNIFTGDIRPGYRRHPDTYEIMKDENIGNMLPQFIQVEETPTMSILPHAEIEDPMETEVQNNPEIAALRSEWDDDDDDEEDEEAEDGQENEFEVNQSRQQVSKIDPQRNLQEPQYMKILQHKSLELRPSTAIVTSAIQPMQNVMTSAYSGGVVLNMNKLTGFLPKQEVSPDDLNPVDQQEYDDEEMPEDEEAAQQRIDENGLETKCHNLLVKLFDSDLLQQCGVGQEHVSTVLGKVLQHYGVKNIGNYGQSQYEVLKFNLWRLLEWKVTIEQMNDFYEENKTVEEMIDDIMNERVPVVPHAVITRALEQEQRLMLQQIETGEVVEQRVVEMVSQQQMVDNNQQPQLLEGHHVVVDSSGRVVEGARVMVDSSGRVVQDNGVMVDTAGNGSTHYAQQIVLQQDGTPHQLSQHQLANLTQMVTISPEMLQGSHLISYDPTTGNIISQVPGDQVVISAEGSTGEEVMVLQQPYGGV